MNNHELWNIEIFPQRLFLYKKSNMPYSVIEGTEHKHTSVHHTCSRFKDNKKYNLTCSNMMQRPFLHYSKYQTNFKLKYILKLRTDLSMEFLFKEMHIEEFYENKKIVTFEKSSATLIYDLMDINLTKGANL